MSAACLGFPQTPRGPRGTAAALRRCQGKVRLRLLRLSRPARMAAQRGRLQRAEPWQGRSRARSPATAAPCRTLAQERSPGRRRRRRPSSTASGGCLRICSEVTRASRTVRRRRRQRGTARRTRLPGVGFQTTQRGAHSWRRRWPRSRRGPRCSPRSRGRPALATQPMSPEAWRREARLRAVGGRLTRAKQRRRWCRCRST